jgi:hypothetical protein
MSVKDGRSNSSTFDCMNSRRVLFLTTDVPKLGLVTMIGRYMYNTDVFGKQFRPMCTERRPKLLNFHKLWQRWNLLSAYLLCLQRLVHCRTVLSGAWHCPSHDLTGQDSFISVFLQVPFRGHYFVMISSFIPRKCVKSMRYKDSDRSYMAHDNTTTSLAGCRSIPDAGNNTITSSDVNRKH